MDLYIVARTANILHALTFIVASSFTVLSAVVVVEETVLEIAEKFLNMTSRNPSLAVDSSSVAFEVKSGAATFDPAVPAANDTPTIPVNVEIYQSSIRVEFSAVHLSPVESICAQLSRVQLSSLELSWVVLSLV